jgi:hypothetical protein
MWWGVLFNSAKESRPQNAGENNRDLTGSHYFAVHESSERITMNQPTAASPLSEKEAMREKLEELKEQAIDLYQIIPGLTECTHLSDLLQKLHELRAGLNQ